jgi:phosphoribosylformimino-5-aminoimidazole carboxamide ribotide isomerase
MDLRDGLVVHAVKGERERYRPVTSVLVDTAKPLAVARVFREKLGLTELYVADLDAIEGRGQHRELIGRLAQEQTALMVDAGVADVAGALTILATGAHKVIVGSETLADWEALLPLRAAVPAGRLVFSLDMRAGRVLWGAASGLASLDPLELLEKLHRAGWQEVILLDLARVGTGVGVDRALITAARQRCPELTLLVGGGVRDADDLWELQGLGVAGALVATALHRGTITQAHLHPFTFRGYTTPSAQALPPPPQTG